MRGAVSIAARLSLLGLSFLAACTTQQQDELARNAARAAITPIIAQHFTGVPLEPAIDCIIDNANAVQLRALALDSVTGPTESTVRIVADIASRPRALRCLAEEGLPAFVANGA